MGLQSGIETARDGACHRADETAAQPEYSAMRHTSGSGEPGAARHGG